MDDQLVNNIYNASPSQRRIWFQSKVANDVPLYNICVGYRLKGELDGVALNQALKILLTRHFTIRSVFKLENNDLVYCILPLEYYALENIDAQNLTDSEIPFFIKETLQQEAYHRFDFENGPLFYSKLYRFSHDDSLIIFSVHHIVSDEWSMGLFTNELTKYYNEYHAHGTINVTPLEFHYHNYVATSENEIQHKFTDHTKEQYKNYFRESKILELPFQELRPNIPSYKGKLYNYRIKNDAALKIKKFISDHKVTPFVMLYSVYALLLYRYTNSQQIYVGTPIADRSNKNIATLIGLIINTVVLKAEFNKITTFKQLLEQSKACTINLFKMMQIPFDAVVNLLNKQHEPSIHPLFQTMFILRNPKKWEFSFNGIEAQQIEPTINISRFDLTLYAQLSDEYVDLVFEYSEDLFDQHSIERMARHYENVLIQAINNIDLELNYFKVITAEEELQILNEFSTSCINNDMEDNLWKKFSENINSKSHDIALITDNVKISYGDLNHRINVLASYIMQTCKSTIHRAAILLARNHYTCIAMYTLWKLGIAFVPLDITQPSMRIEEIIADANIDLLIIDDLGRVTPKMLPLEKLLLNDELFQNKFDQAVVPYSNKHSNIAYIIYTSGSTGKPKGVVVERLGVNNVLQHFFTMLALQKGETCLSTTTITFDISILEIFLVMLGITVIFPNENDCKNPKALLKLIANTHIDVMQATPSMWQMLLNADVDETMHIDKILCGGEAANKKLVEKLLNHCNVLYNVYGPTETTIWSTSAHITNPENIHIGRPIANTSIYILDDQLNCLPIAIPGELYIGGIGLAQGYHNLPELTHNNFITTAKYADRLYRTGDICCWDENGNIKYLCRADQQIKLRGYRIELGEIAAIIREIPDIIDVAIVLSQHESDRVYLIAYLCTKNNINNPSDEIHINEAPSSLTNMVNLHVSSKLPKYMVPSKYIEINKLPKTTNNKVDLQTLLKLLDTLKGSSNSDNATIHGYSESSIEFKIAKIWNEILNISCSNVNDDFFQLGGSSISLALLQKKLEQTFLCNFRIVKLYQYTTIQQQAQLISKLHLNKEVTENAWA